MNSFRTRSALSSLARGIFLAAVVGLVAACAPQAELEAPVHPTGNHARPALPDAPGDLRSRADLQTLVERQSRRDTTLLVEALTSADATIRARAALALGSVRAVSAIPALVPLLTDSVADVRALAAFALGQVGDAQLTGPLLDALRAERDLAVQKQLLDALGKTGDRSALAAVAGLSLSADQEADRALAIARFGLREVFDPTAVALLARQVGDPQIRVRRDASYFFGRIPDASVWRDHVPRIVETAARLDVDDPALLHLALALGRIEHADAVPLLIRLLSESPDWRTRTNAARALADKDHSDVREALLAALNDTSHHVASAAGQAISAEVQRRPATLDKLQAWLVEHPGQWATWSAFLPALVVGERTETVLFALDVAGPAAGTYAQAATVRSLVHATSPVLLARLADSAADPDVRVAAAAIDAWRARWLADRSPEHAHRLLPIFSEGIRRGDVGTVYAAAPALADSIFFALGAGDVLRETYASMAIPADIEPMAAIIRAHHVARDQVALDFLVDVALEGPHPILRHAATEALNSRFDGFDFEATGLRAPSFPRLDRQRLSRLGQHPRLILETERGNIVLELLPDWAPMTTLTITRFASEGRYDGVPFHRVVPNFVVQGGDFAREDGFGGPDFFLPSEFTPLPYHTGTLGMASAGPDTEGSQFFVTHSMQPHLDGRYTVFGRILSGQEVVDALRVGDRIVRARIENDR